MTGPEKIFENKIKRFLNGYSIWHVKFFANAMTKTGIPDILCNVNGRFVVIEVKAEQGKPSALQKQNLNYINQTNGIGILAFPSGFNDLKEFIKLINKNPNIDIKNYINEENYIKFKKVAHGKRQGN